MRYEVVLNIATITLKKYLVEADSAEDAEEMACDMEDVGTPPDDSACISHDRTLDSVKALDEAKEKAK